MNSFFILRASVAAMANFPISPVFISRLVKVILAVHSSMVMVCKLGSYHGVWDVEEVNFLEYTPVPVD